MEDSILSSHCFRETNAYQLGDYQDQLEVETERARFLKNREATLGDASGEFVCIGEQKIEESSVRLVGYNNEQLNEKNIDNIEVTAAYKKRFIRLKRTLFHEVPLFSA